MLAVLVIREAKLKGNIVLRALRLNTSGMPNWYLVHEKSNDGSVTLEVRGADGHIIAVERFQGEQETPVGNAEGWLIRNQPRVDAIWRIAARVKGYGTRKNLLAEFERVAGSRSRSTPAGEQGKEERALAQGRRDSVAARGADAAVDPSWNRGKASDSSSPEVSRPTLNGDGDAGENSSGSQAADVSALGSSQPGMELVEIVLTVPASEEERFRRDAAEAVSACREGRPLPREGRAATGSSSWSGWTNLGHAPHPAKQGRAGSLRRFSLRERMIAEITGPVAPSTTVTAKALTALSESWTIGWSKAMRDQHMSLTLLLWGNHLEVWRHGGGGTWLVEINGMIDPQEHETPENAKIHAVRSALCLLLRQDGAADGAWEINEDDLGLIAQAFARTAGQREDGLRNCDGVPTRLYRGPHDYRLGLQTAPGGYKAIVFPGGGRWHHRVEGVFPTRNEALAAVSTLALREFFSDFQKKSQLENALN